MLIKYIVEATKMLFKLEAKFAMTKYQKLSSKLGIMVDDYNVHKLPNKFVPIRTNGTNQAVQDHEGLKIYVCRNNEDLNSYLLGIDIYEIGNELENPEVSGAPVYVAEYLLYLLRWDGPKPIANPGLSSINQSQSYWRKLTRMKFEDEVDYVAAHLYIQNRTMERIDNTWVAKKWYRKLSDKWEYVKAIAALMELRDSTTKPILMTECGVTSLTAETPEDIYWMDLLLNEVLGDRLKAAMWYDFNSLTEYPGKAILAYY